MNSSRGEIASRSDLKLVRTIQAIGKNSSSATSQPNTVASRRCSGVARIAYTSSRRAMLRTRKKATMLARTMATTPPAEAPPISYCSKARA